MKMTKLARFIIAIVLQIIVIFTIIILKLSVLAGGTEIFLRITPVDPTSPLRGDYVTFRYDISNIDSYYLNGLQVRNGDTVYVILRNEGKYWGVESVKFDKPIDVIFIKGRVTSGGSLGGRGRMLAALPHILDDTDNIQVTYGIEEYFIPEGKGRNFNFWNKEAAAGIVVDEDGNAVLKRIYVDDKPWP